MPSCPYLVLAVDDEMAMCELTKIFLEMSGHLRVDVAGSVAEARKALSKRHYDAVVSDYQMPLEDGIQFLKSLRSLEDTTPFILFTGKGREDVVIEALNSGVDSYLQKGGEATPQYAELEHRIISLVHRHRAEEALRFSESKLQHAEELAGIGYWQIDVDRMLISGSRGSVLLCGVDKDVFSFEEWMAMMVPEDVPLIQRTYRGMVDEGRPYNIEYRLVRPKDGKVIIVHSQAEYDPERRMLFGTLLDITARKSSEDAQRVKNEELQAVNELLRKEKTFSETLIDSMPGIFYLYDAKTMKMVGWNKIHQDVSGFMKEEMQDRSVLDWFPPERRSKARRIIEESLGKGLGGAETVILTKDGRQIPYLLTVRPLEVDGHSYFMGMGIDITERKRMEEELRRSEDHLNQLAKQSRIVTWEVDANGLYTYVSHVSEDVWGFKPQDLVGKKHFYDLAPGTDREAIKERAMAVFELKDLFVNFENRIERGDSTIICVSTNGMPVLGPDGSLKGYQGSDTDITERIKVMRSLEGTRAAIESSIDGIALLDPDGRYVYLNQAHATIYGYSSVDELIGKSWKVLYDDEVGRNFEHDNMPILFSEGRWRGESVGLRKDGSRFAQEVSLTELKDHGLICIVRDMTEKAQAEEALRQKTAMFEAQSKVSIDGMMVVDADMHRIYANERIAELFDAPDEIMDDEDDSFLLHHVARLTRDPDEFLERVLHYYSHIDMVGREEIELRNGRVLDRYTAPVLGKDGKYYGRTWMFRDVTERRRDERALHEANRKLNLLSSITRHDINNQLLVLSSNLTLLEYRNLEGQAGSYLNRAMKAAERISNMIQFTREYQDIGVRAPVWHNIRSLLDRTMSDVRVEGVRIVNDVPKDLEVFADPLISKVFHNLMQNAIQHGGDVTTLRFWLEEVDGVFMVICQDDGVGISPEMRGKLFTKGAGTGQGFGLFLCREILAITRIAITEEGLPGEGAKFVLTMPVDGIKENRA
jgi:PAS domain S-box-containing protein